MNDELATHISLLAAPLYAAILLRHPGSHDPIPYEKLSIMRRDAITQAYALWLDTRETEL